MIENKELKICLLSTSDTAGGASIAAYNLLRGLDIKQIKAVMLVQKKYSDNQNVLAPETLWWKLKSKILAPGFEDLSRKIIFRNEKTFYSPAMASSFDFERLKKINPDLVHLHWINRGYLTPNDLLKIKKPLVWTLHDMWPFCGGEHYGNEKIKRYQIGYDKNNRPVDNNFFDKNKFLWLRKKSAWKNLDKINIVCPSQWLAKCARESVLFKNYNVSVIPYGLDTDIFKPIEKQTVRDILGLPKNKKIILFGAMGGTSNPRKGFSFLREAIIKLEQSVIKNDLALAVVGASATTEKLNWSIPTYFLGRLNDAVSMAIAYSASDVFVAPSLQDNLPNTVLESMACGTPVVAFDIGGMPDMIDHQQNGYLVKPLDSVDLASGLEWILSDDLNWQALSRRAREKCEQEYTLKKQAENYLELYRKIL
ncbi:MAG: glycosyltransferase family 4 protein [bacterium]